MEKLYINKKIRRDFDVIREFEAGIILEGWEVKSIKSRNFSAEGAYVVLRENEAYILSLRVKRWQSSYWLNDDIEGRERKLLLNRSEILSIQNQMGRKNLTIVISSIYTNQRGLIKVRIALVKGLKKFDKRSMIRKKEIQKRIDQDRQRYNF